jgi:hypothetical protein
VRHYEALGLPVKQLKNVIEASNIGAGPETPPR